MLELNLHPPIHTSLSFGCLLMTYQLQEHHCQNNLGMLLVLVGLEKDTGNMGFHCDYKQPAVRKVDECHWSYFRYPLQVKYDCTSHILLPQTALPALLNAESDTRGWQKSALHQWKKNL